VPQTAGQQPDAVVNTTQRHLDEMQLRVAEHDLPGGPADRELTEMKQRLIVERASAILFEKGFHGTSIRDIAAACDMSMGQLYHYISSKDDILFLMHLYSQEQWHRHLSEGGFEQITDPAARLEHGLRISMKYLSENRDLFQFIFTESKYMDREHLQKALELDDRNVVGFYRHLLSGIPGQPAAGTAHELAANAVAFLCTLLALRGWNLDLPDEGAVDGAIDFLVEFIFRGLGIERG
jgi:TetR/AcrR family transcriptional regulator, cholesterol catabolism regulator